MDSASLMATESGLLLMKSFQASTSRWLAHFLQMQERLPGMCTGTSIKWPIFAFLLELTGSLIAVVLAFSGCGLLVLKGKALKEEVLEEEMGQVRTNGACAAIVCAVWSVWGAPV